MKQYIKDNRKNLCLACITCAAITVAGLYYQQEIIRILPLYVSLVIGFLQAGANRYASLLGGFNSLLYAVVYFQLGLYASAGYALLFSCPVQLVTFARWSRNAYQHSTQFRKLSGRQRIWISAAFLVCFTALYAILSVLGSEYQFLDNISSLLGILISLLTMLAFIEYTWLMLPSGIISIFLNLATMKTHPDQMTYLIFSIYSMICVTRGFFSVRKLYAEQMHQSDSKKIIHKGEV